MRCRGQRVRSKVNRFGVRERREDAKFRERRSARWNGTSVSVVGSSETRCGRTSEEGHALSLSPCSPASFSHPVYLSLYSFRRHRYHALPQSRTDGQNLNNSTFVQARREAVRKIALSMMNSVRSARLRGPPRPPIGRERRDRERYRHEGTNYPPTIATTIRTRPPPPSATTPRFGVRDEERHTENGTA